MNIFIVEDSPLLAASLKQLVLKLGHNVAGISSSYDDAISKINAGVDMVITDIMLMGPQNGIELATYIKRHFNIPVVYQSSITDSLMVGDAMRTNPLAFLSKPVTHLELYTVLGYAAQH